jgi:hypothetical protein
MVIVAVGIFQTEHTKYALKSPEATYDSFCIDEFKYFSELIQVLSRFSKTYFYIN